MIDCHCHLDEAITPLDKVIASQEAAGIEKTALIAPLCPDIATTWFMRLASKPFLKFMGSRNALANKAARALYASWVKESGQVDVGGILYPLDPRPENERIAQVVAEHPDRFFGWIFVNPKGGVDAVEEASRFMNRPGMIGVKAHPFWHDYPVSMLTDVAALCSEKGMPMLLHLGVGERGDYRFLPERFPRLNIIYAHAGIPFQHEILAYAAKTPNVYVDLSCSAYVNDRIYQTALATAGPGKCLFGSDGPYFHHDQGSLDYAYFTNQLNRLVPDESNRKKVGGENFLKILEGE